MSSSEPIRDPYFTFMELLILAVVPLMVISMASLNIYAPPEKKVYAKIAVAFMIIMTVITSCVHFVVLIFNHQVLESDLMNLFFSFNWPSVAYILDILAWDWFFALSFLFASLIFKKGKFENVIGVLMIVSGSLSLAGLIGVPLNNMGIRNIGIIGYALVSPAAFLMLSRLFHSRLNEIKNINHVNHPG